MFYLKIEMNEKDKRLDDKPSSLVVRDSLRDLAMKKAKLEFSERKPKESFIGKGFFRP
jgi:hypothetical protein